MSTSYAVCHIGVRGKRFRPGERLPELTDEEWKRLSQLRAIRTEFTDAAQEATSGPEAQETENPQTSADSTPAARGPEQDEADDDPMEEQTGEDEDGPEEMPEIDATDGIVDEEDEQPAKTAPRGRRERA